MKEHPTPAELDAVLRGGLSPERQKAVFVHLLRGCETCRAVLSAERRSLRASPPVTPREEAAYDEAIDRAFVTAVRHERRLRRPLPRSEESVLVDAGAEGNGDGEGGAAPGPELAHLHALLGRSWAQRHENPRAMVSLARCALVVAQSLDPCLHGERRVADLQARTWGELGNALRTADDLDEAGSAFDAAFERLSQGSGDELLEARLRDLRASFLGCRRCFDRAFEELESLGAFYRRRGDDHLAGRALIKKAIYLHYAGRSGEALRINEEGMALADPEREPGLLCTAVHNQLWFLVAGGRFAEAERFLRKREAPLRGMGQVLGLKLRWLEGLIAGGLEQWGPAERALLEARQGLEEAGLGFNAALASLDLALLRMRQGRSRETAELVAQAAVVFETLRVPREALAAVRLLEQAFRMQRASRTLLESTVEFLRWSEADPQARYEPRFV
ncbi:MAG TPA: hypothetical protein VGH73_12560 [Thermoanaerobaculia bacterium]